MTTTMERIAIDELRHALRTGEANRGSFEDFRNSVNDDLAAGYRDILPRDVWEDCVSAAWAAFEAKGKEALDETD